MLVWLKNSETGKWNRTGEPLEKYVQISIDEGKPGNGVYLLNDGIEIVQKAIAPPDNGHYRYELPPASGAALRRVGVAAEGAPATAKEPKKAHKPAKEPKPKKAAKVEAEEPARITAAKITVELKPVESYKAFMATVHGKKAVVVFQERNRSKAELRNNPVTIPESRFSDGSKLAKESGAPIYVGLQVKVAGRWDSGWLIPAVLFKQWRRKQDFVLTPDARAAYAADKSSVLGVRFVEAKA